MVKSKSIVERKGAMPGSGLDQQDSILLSQLEVDQELALGLNNCNCRILSYHDLCCTLENPLY